MISFIFLLTPYIWSGPINISESDDIQSKWPDIVIDRNDKIWIVWSEDYDSNPTKMTYRYYEKENGWSDTTVLIIQGGACCNSELSIDSVGKIHWVWSCLGEGKLYWSFYEKDKWSSPIKIGNDFGSNERQSITSSPDGKTHLAWSVYGDEDPYYSFFDGDSWSTPVIMWDNIKARPHAITSDKHNRIHVLWRNLENRQLEYTIYDGERWSEPEILTDVETYVKESKIVVDKDDNIYIVYESAYSSEVRSHLYFIENKGDGWSQPYKIDLWEGNDGGGYFPDMRIDSKGILHIIWSGGPAGIQWHLYHTMYDGKEWLTYQITSVEDYPSHSRGEGDTQLFIDKDDNLYVTSVVNIGPAHNVVVAFEVYLNTTNLKLGVKEKKIKNKTEINIINKNITILLKESSYVKLRVYDTTGREIYKKDLGNLNKGKHNINIKKDLSDGVYFVKFDFDNFSISKKLLIK